MKKRLFALALSVVTCLSLAACGGGSKAPAASSTSADAAASAATSTPASGTTLKVGATPDVYKRQVTTKPCEATSTETYSDRIFALTPSASSKAVIEGKDNQYQMCFMDPKQLSLIHIWAPFSSCWPLWPPSLPTPNPGGRLGSASYLSGCC